MLSAHLFYYIKYKTPTLLFSYNQFNSRFVTPAFTKIMLEGDVQAYKGEDPNLDY